MAVFSIKSDTILPFLVHAFSALFYYSKCTLSSNENKNGDSRKLNRFCMLHLNLPGTEMCITEIKNNFKIGKCK